jgi:hypothetical protein
VSKKKGECVRVIECESEKERGRERVCVRDWEKKSVCLGERERVGEYLCVIRG